MRKIGRKIGRKICRKIDNISARLKNNDRTLDKNVGINVE